MPCPGWLPPWCLGWRPPEGSREISGPLRSITNRLQGAEAAEQRSRVEALVGGVEPRGRVVPRVEEEQSGRVDLGGNLENRGEGQQRGEEETSGGSGRSTVAVLREEQRNSPPEEGGGGQVEESSETSEGATVAGVGRRTRKYLESWCPRLRDGAMYVEGSLLDQGGNLSETPYHTARVVAVVTPRRVVGASGKEYVLEGKMVPRESAFPSFLPMDLTPQFVLDR